MTKIKLGNDFNDENAPDKAPIEESAEKTSDEESEDEKENSADTDDSKNQEDKTDKKSIDDVEGTDADKSDDKSDDDKKVPDKNAVLQGLLETEKGLEKNNTDIDTAIAAARLRISQKRGERREKRDLAGTIDSKFPDTQEEADDLSDIDTDTLKVLDRYTRSKGLVPKSEFQKMSYQERHKASEESFYEKHPEYLPENDSDDTLYNSLKKELSLYATPSDPKLISRLFEKAHDSVLKLYPTKFKTSKSEYNIDKDINKSVRIKSRALGGSSGGSGADKSDSSGSDKKSFSEVQIRALQDGGWSEEEIKALTK